MFFFEKKRKVNSPIFTQKRHVKIAITKLRGSFLMATTSINHVQLARHAPELPLLLQYMANILQKKKRDPKASEQTPTQSVVT